MGWRTTNGKGYQYASTAVKVGGRKEQGIEVGRRVQGEYRFPKGLHSGQGIEEDREGGGGEG